MGKTVEIHEVKEMTWEEIRNEMCLGEEEALAIDKAGKGDDFLCLLEEWKDEEALPNKGRGYWTLADIDEWLAFDWHDIAPALGIEESA